MPSQPFQGDLTRTVFLTEYKKTKQGFYNRPLYLRIIIWTLLPFQQQLFY